MPTNSQSICGLVLAGGKGTRMNSDLPKVLHKIGDKSLFQWVLDALMGAGIEDVCAIIGGECERFDPLLAKYPRLAVCEQVARQGTGDAVAAAADYFSPLNSELPSFARGRILRGRPRGAAGYVLICLGDAPAIQSKTIIDFTKTMQAKRYKFGVLGMIHPRPQGYGRLLLDAEGCLNKIVEEKNATDEERKIQLCNSGVIFAEIEILFRSLLELKPNALTNEYYLTDCVEIARNSLGVKVGVYSSDNCREFEGINDPNQLVSVAKSLGY